MAQGKSVRHHFVPQFYLQGFVDPENPPFMWVYRKDGDQIIKSSVKDTAVHSHYYSFDTKSGARDSQSIEKFFSELEGNTATVFKKILNKEALNNDERSIFSAFLAFTFTRVPNYRENMVNKPTGQLMKKVHIMMASDKDRFEAHIRKFEADTGNKVDMPLEELRQYILKGNYDVKVGNPGYSLSFLLRTAEDLIPIFHQMHWAFLETSDDMYFLTSDNPLYYMDSTHKPGSFYGVGLLNKSIEVTFPISKNLMFLGTWEGSEGYLPATEKIRDILNRRTITSAKDFVFAPENSIELSKLVQKYKGSAPRMTVS